MRGATEREYINSLLSQISIHAPHAGSDAHHALSDGVTYFNPRSPCGERLSKTPAYGGRQAISIHAPHAGSDHPLHHQSQKAMGFQSTLPMRGATPCVPTSVTHKGISIHAPHAGSDCRDHRSRCRCRDFNPRSPCGERRGNWFTGIRTRDFNPRSPCGERLRAGRNRAESADFNPRSPCGERRGPCG